MIDGGCFGWNLDKAWWKERGGQQSGARERWVISWCFRCVSWWEESERERLLTMGRRKGRVTVARYREEERRGKKGFWVLI